MEGNLFNLTPTDGFGVDGEAIVRPNVWLLTADEVAPLWLSVGSAARCLGVEASEVEQLVVNGDLPGVEVGGQLAICATALGKYVAGLVRATAVAPDTTLGR